MLINILDKYTNSTFDKLHKELDRNQELREEVFILLCQCNIYHHCSKSQISPSVFSKNSNEQTKVTYSCHFCEKTLEVNYVETT